MDDLRAVLEAAGSPRTSIFAAGDGGDLALVFAATYPDRVQAVVVWDGNFRGSWAPDYPWAPPTFSGAARDRRHRAALA